MTQERDFLRGPVPSDCELAILAKYLGLGTIDGHKKWIQLPEFKAFFSTTYMKRQILPRCVQNEFKQGPRLDAVQAVIKAGEHFGEERYSDPQEEGYERIDYYALCLFRLRQKNRVARKYRWFSMERLKSKENLEWVGIKSVCT
jgi:hypothetical protein